MPDAFNGQSYNRYAYVTNNPLSFTDVTGHYVGDNSIDGLSGSQSDFTAAAELEFGGGGGLLGLVNDPVFQGSARTTLNKVSNNSLIGYSGNQSGIAETTNTAAADVERGLGHSNTTDENGNNVESVFKHDLPTPPSQAAEFANGANSNSAVYYPETDNIQLVPIIHPIPFVLSQETIDDAKANFAQQLQRSTKLTQSQAREIAGEVIDNLSLGDARTLQGIAPGPTSLTVNQAQLSIIQNQVNQLTPDVRATAQAALQSALKAGTIKVGH